MADEPNTPPPPEKPAAPTPPAKPAGAAGGHAAPKPPAAMAATAWDGDLPRALKTHFGEQVLETATYLGQNFAVVKAEAAIAVVEYLKLEADFDYLVDLTAVHYPERSEPFDVVWVLYSFQRNERVRVKARLASGSKPPTATDVHVGANWLEREVFDMFGIEFAGHPDMRRILLPEDWQGHPLLKTQTIIQMDNRWVQENLGIESGQ